MLVYFNILKYNRSYKSIKKFFKTKLLDIRFVETLAKFLDVKLRNSKNNYDLVCNLNELINDLNYLKQYLD